MISKVLSVLVLTLTMASSAREEMFDVAISASRKKLDEQKTHAGDKTSVTKEVAYTLTLESHSFKPLTGLQVKYMIFYQDQQPGSVGKPIIAFNKGTATLAGLGVHETATVDTTSFKLTTTELDAGWYYTSGASGRAQDRVTGVWVRVYSDGKLVGEYANPPGTAKKNTWKD